MKTHGIDINRVRVTPKEQAKVEAALSVLAKLGATPSKKVLRRIKMASRVRLDRDAITRIEDMLTLEEAADIVYSRKSRTIIVYSRDSLAKKQEHGRKLGSGALNKPKPFLSRLSPEDRRAISRKGGLAAAKKRAEKAAMKKKRGPHWTQKPENRDKVMALTKKATAARHTKTSTAGA